MKTEKFKDLYFFHPKSNIKAGDGIENGEFPFYTSSEKLTKTINTGQFNTRALVFGTGGKASIHFAEGRFSVSTDCIVASSQQQHFNIKFVYYYLFGNIYLLERGFKGAGLKHISKKYIENLDIPIFPIETQNKIVAILDKASSLVTKREESVFFLNELVRTTFLEMFGNVVSFDKTETSVPLRNYLSIKHGFAFKSKYYEEAGKYVLLTPGNFYESGGYKDRSEKQKYYIGDIPTKYTLKKDDLLVAMTEQAPGLLGSPLFVPENDKFLHNQRLGLIQIKDKKIEKTFLFYLFNTGLMRSIIHARAVGVKVRHTSPTKIESIEIILPELIQQKKFSSYAKHIENNLLKAELSKTQIYFLFKSILQKVFNGQLNFNVDFELDSLIQEIDLQKKENDLSKITGDIAYLQRLVDKLNNQEFKEKDLYDKAKHGVFQLMVVKEEERKVVQEYDEKSKSIKLSIK